MIFFLKQTCGYEFTGKLARMFQDIKVSDDLNIEFFDYVKSELSSTTQHQTMTNLIGLDFNIYVLQVKEKSFFFDNDNKILFILSGKFLASCVINNKYIHSSSYS
jgi:hypothetical protein